MGMSSHQAFDGETQAVLASRDFNKIALAILSHLINQDFEIIDCNLPKYPDGGDACARYNGSKGMRDVMSQIGVTGKRFFLTPDPPYVYDRAAGWYTTVWAVPTTRYTFTVVVSEYHETLDDPKFIRVRVSYSEDEKWDDLYPPR